MGPTACAWPRCRKLNPAGVPAEAEETLPLAEKIRRSRPLIPVVLLIVGVIGSIYAGLASPTESAAVGVALAHLLSWRGRSLNRGTFAEALMGTVKTSTMIAFILVGAHFLTVSMGFTGIPRELASWINTLSLSPYMLLLVLTVFFILLGCFLDGISVVVLTTSVILPMVQAAGIDQPFGGFEQAGDPGLVYLGHGPPRKQLGQRPGGPGIVGDQHQPGGVPVEPVDQETVPLQLHLRPAQQAAMVPSLRPLGQQAVGLEPHRVATTVFQQLRRLRFAGQHGVVVEQL